MAHSFLKFAKDELLKPMWGGAKKSTIYRKYFRHPEAGNNFGLLSEEEIKYIMVFSEAIYFTSNTEGTEKLHKIVRKSTERSTKMDGNLEVYQQGIATLKMITKNEGYNALFYDLPAPERKKIIDKVDYLFSNLIDRPSFHHPFKIFIFVWISITKHRTKRQVFFLKLLRKDLIKGIFSSNIGWQIVGNYSKPGMAGNYRDYTDAPNSNLTSVK